VRRIKLKSEFVLDLLNLLVEVGNRFHDFGFAADEVAQFLATVIADGIEESVDTFFNLIIDVAKQLLLRAHQPLGEKLLVVLHDLHGFPEAERVLPAGTQGMLSCNQATVGKLSHFPIRRPHKRHHVSPEVGADFRQFLCDSVHFVFSSGPNDAVTPLFELLIIIDA